MKTLNITKRDIKVFLLGIATMLALDLAYNWESHKSAFMHGVEGASADGAKSTESLRIEMQQ